MGRSSTSVMAPSYSPAPTRRDRIAPGRARPASMVATVRREMVGNAWARAAGSLHRGRRALGDAGVAAALVALAGLLALAALVWTDQLRPASVLAIPLLIGGLLLPRREVRLLLLGSVLLIVLVTSARGWDALNIGTSAV